MTQRMTVFLAIALAAVGGCGQKKRGFTLKEILSSIRGTSRQEMVRNMLESPDPDVRREGIEDLSSKSWGREAPYPKAYALMTDDPEPGVRAAAVRALGKVGDPTYLPELVKALKDPDQRVRWDSAVALDKVIGPEAVKPLETAALTDTSRDVRSSAATALRHYPRADVLETLLACLDDPDFAVRFKAGESLSELTGECAGTDREAWQRALAGKSDPFVKPAKPKRPWWDWFGTTETKAPAAPPPPPPSAAPYEPPKPKRPWWDWFGVTEKEQAGPPPADEIEDVRPTRPPATAPAEPVKPKRPWWDWFGITEKNDSPSPTVEQAPPATAPADAPEQPAKPRRPWWDWFGVTAKNSGS